MTTETGSKVFEELFQNVRKATEASLKMHQELFGQWASLWPVSGPQTIWMEKMRDFQKQWGNAVSDLARKHRDVMDRQYQAALESLDAALRVGEATSPEEYRRRAEQLCRKTLDCVREVSEAQFREFQEAVARWTELATKAGT